MGPPRPPKTSPMTPLPEATLSISRALYNASPHLQQFDAEPRMHLAFQEQSPSWQLTYLQGRLEKFADMIKSRSRNILFEQSFGHLVHEPYIEHTSQERVKILQEYMELHSEILMLKELKTRLERENEKILRAEGERKDTRLE